MRRSKPSARCVGNKVPQVGPYEITLVVVIILVVTAMTASGIPSALSLTAGVQAFDLGLRLKKRLKITSVRLVRVKAA